MSYIPFRCYTHGSILLSQTKPKEIVKRLDELELDSCAITDINNMSMSIQYYNAIKASGRKPIFGCTINIDGIPLIVIARNFSGWKNLLFIVMKANINPALTLKELRNYDSDDLIFLTDTEYIPFKILRNYYSIPMPTPYYLTKNDWDDNKVLIYSANKITYKQKDSCPIRQLHMNEYYLLSDKEMLDIHSRKDLDKTNEIFDSIEEFDILNKPNLPNIPDSYNKLYNLCIAGSNRIGKNNEEYISRLNKEMEVIKNADLSSYFLIVYDIVNYIRQTAIVGSGRGSVSGSIIPYFLGITEVDPIEYGLIFERFYNAGRNTKDKISLPDIDLDVPSYIRDDCISYLKSRYGTEKVAQMITFQTMKGSRSLTDVLRLTTDFDFSYIKSLTKRMPMEGRISPQLKEMKKRLGYESIIRWVLENERGTFSSLCELDNDGNLVGEYSEVIARAIRLESTNCAFSKHPAGIVISDDYLYEICPMILDNDGEIICGLTMKDLEAVGGVKFDVLGVKVLDTLLTVQEIVKNKI